MAPNRAANTFALLLSSTGYGIAPTPRISLATDLLQRVLAPCRCGGVSIARQPAEQRRYTAASKPTAY